MEKYYIPDITEFCVGFKVELYSSDIGCWGTYEYKENNKPSDFKDDIEIEACRVKYLDEQDIKSLGWKQDENYPTQYYLKSTDFSWILVEFDDFINIETNSGHINFNVTIKNKSELRKLMQQLGI